MKSPLSSGILYCILGAFLTYFAIIRVSTSGWGFFSYLLVLLATFEFGAGIRLMILHFKIKKNKNKK